MGNSVFSVIVPVYNVKDYIEQCVNSIINQNFVNYELILVDDGSNDGSGKICDYYAANYPFCKVLHKTNGGLSDARNAGIEIANGMYLWFIDSDDYLLDLSALRIVANIIDTQKPDIIFFSYKKYYEKFGFYSKSIISCSAESTDISEYIKTNAYKALACNKVIKLSVVKEHNMRFPLGYLGEDMIWCVDILAYSDKIVLCNKDLMAYRQRDNSITGNMDKDFRKRHIGDTLHLINKAINTYDISADLSRHSLIGHFLSYEYSWLLGMVYPYWEEYSEQIRVLSFLLNYDLSQKVVRVKKLRMLFGLRGASLLAWWFINIRKSKISKVLRLC